MGAFNLVRNGLALVAGAALLDVIMDEFNDSGSSQYSETDREHHYREGVDKMADLKINNAKEKMEQFQKLAEEKKQQYDELTKELREMVITLGKMVENRVSDDNDDDDDDWDDDEDDDKDDDKKDDKDEVVVEDEVTNEETADKNDLAEMKKQLEKLQQLLDAKTKATKDEE